MFYVIDKENKLSLFDDDKQKLENTRKFMPQLDGQYTLETNIVTADELRVHLNKVLVDDIEIEIDVPDYDEESNPIMIEYEDTETVIDYDEEGNPISSHEITVIKHKQSTHKETITVKGLVPNPDYEQEEQEKEKERVNNLKMTALDFIGALQSFGLTLEQINTYLESNLTVKMQLTYCQNVYCGVAKSFMPITVDNITITSEMIENAFKVKNGQ